MSGSDPNAHVLAGDRSISGPSAWHKAALIGGVLLAAVLLLSPSVASLWVIWNDTEARAYTHGPLVALVCVWLLVQRRDELAQAVIAPAYWLAGCVALISLAWVIAFRSGLQLIHEVLFPLLVWLTVWAALGASAAKTCAFSILYLYFAVPVWSVGNGILQAMTVFATDLMLKVTGVPAHVEGNLVNIPSGVFEIAGGCSGLHFFVVALAVAALFGEINRDSPKVRVLLLLLAGVVAVVTNWIRVFTIIVAGHLTDMQHYLVKVDHYYFGWVVFAIGMAGFFFFARRFPIATYSSAVKSSRPTALGRTSLRGAVLAILALAVGPLLLWHSTGLDAAASLSGSTLPASPNGWAGPMIAHTPWQPEYKSADSAVLGEYRRGTQSVSVFVASYGSQTQGKEIIGYDNSLIGQDAEILSRRELSSSRPAHEMEVQGPATEHALIWYHYEVGSQSFIRDLSAQLFYGVSSLLGPAPSRIVALRARCDQTCDEARALLDEFSSILDDGVPRNSTERN